MTVRRWNNLVVLAAVGLALGCGESSASRGGRVPVGIRARRGQAVAPPQSGQADDGVRRAGRPQRPVDGRGVCITLLHVNDTHGRLYPHRHGGRVVGGFARLATIVKRVRRERGDANVLLIHAGDVLSRGDELTRRTRGAANVALMNALGFDAWTPGNGEFYDGLDVLRRRIAEANFPVLTSNVLRSETGEPLGRESVVRRVGGVRVGLLGLCTVRPDTRAGLEVLPPLPTACRTAEALRKRADVVVAVTHLGHVFDWLLAWGAGRRLDVIVGGHSHTLLPEGTTVTSLSGRRTLIVQAGEYCRHVGRVDLTFRRREGGFEWVGTSARVIPLDETVGFDPSIRRRMSAWKEKARRRRRPAGRETRNPGPSSTSKDRRLRQ